MREFVTAAKKVADPEDWIEFKVDDHVCRAVGEPSDGQLAYVMARSGRGVPKLEQIAAMLNFFDSALDDDTQIYISGRMLDPDDPFGSEEIGDIIGFLTEEWAGRPTRRSSASTQPPTTTGPSSTPLTPAST